MCRFSLVRRCRFAATALALTAFFLAGCATTKVQSQWTDPQFAGRSFRGDKILVVCAARETAIQRNCEDQIRAQVTAMGALPVSAPAADQLAVSAGAADEKTLAAASALGAQAIFAANVVPDATVVSPGPTIGFGIGSGSWGGGTSVGGGVGVSMPVGSAAVNTAYGADMVVTDVKTGRIVWTSKVTTPASGDVTAQIAQLARVGAEAAKKAGVF